MLREQKRDGLKRFNSITQIGPPAKSKKAISLKTPKQVAAELDTIVSMQQVEDRGVLNILEDLRNKDAELESRTHAFLHYQIATGYQVALCAVGDLVKWKEICDSPLLADAPRKPNIKRPNDALRFVLMLCKGVTKNGRSFASKWSRRLKDDFEQARFATAVLQSISRKGIPTAPRVLSERKAPKIAARLGTVEGEQAYVGTWTAGKRGSVEFVVPPDQSSVIFLVTLPMPVDRKATTMTPVTLERAAAYLMKAAAKTKQVETER